uniref:DNA polymerase processivity factor n=1 Tax=Rousettus bat poxvirus TaxID=3141933 RepID=A0AAU7E1N2_9POXV
MSKEDDLTKLKELVELRRRGFARGVAAERHRALTDWATRTYWTIAPGPEDGTRMSVACAARSSVYTDIQRRPFMLRAGAYTFTGIYFGRRLLFADGALVDASSGEHFAADENTLRACGAIARATRAEFLRLCAFRERIVLEDVHSAACAPHAALALAAGEGLCVAVHARIAVEHETLLSEEYFYALMRRLRHTDGHLHVTAVCCVRDGTAERRVVDFAQTVYCCVQKLELDCVEENKFLPVVVTFTGERALVADLDHLVRARVRVGAFVAMRKLRTVTVVSPTAVSSSVLETPHDALRRLVRYFSNEYFANGRYLSRLEVVSLAQLSNRMGITVPCATPEELAAMLMRNPSQLERMQRLSPFELTCEYLDYNRADVVSLINSMNFKIERRKIVSFELASAARVAGNSTLEALYSNFYQFVAVFNFLADAWDVCARHAEESGAAAAAGAGGDPRS